MDTTALAILTAELTNDPLAIGYAAMSDSDAATALNAVNRQRIRSAMSGDELFAQTDTAEFAAQKDTQRSLLASVSTRDVLDPGSAANAALVQSIFGAASTTVTALAAALPTRLVHSVADFFMESR